ncbi:MAG: TRAP transporter substrate-binding protein DctP [Pseudomonadota bacterium]
MKKQTTARAIASLAAALLLTACSRTVTTGVTDLVYATPYSPGHPFSRADSAWMAFVERRSGGRLRIRPNWSGALISADHSMIELRHGVADIGLIMPIYVKGGAHLIRIQSGFYSGVVTIPAQLALYRCLAASSAQYGQELEGLHVLAVQGGSLPGIVTRNRPVRRLEDLAGLRIRAPTELLGVLRELGADPVNLPMGEVYSALAKGVIDGVVAPADTFKSLHFAEVAHYFTLLAVPRGAYPARAMSVHRWAGLAAADREILEEGRAIWEGALERETTRAVEEGFALARRTGIEFIPVDEAEQRRFDQIYLKHARRNAISLARFGIDGLAVYETARRSIADGGAVRCSKGA